VTDTNVSLPAYAGVPPSYTACLAGAATTTKRITVVVQPAQSANQLYADPPVILQGWITLIPGGI
jgi:phage-related tail fiber protein